VLLRALLRPGSLVLLLSPTARQSVELLRKVRSLYDAAGRPIPSIGDPSATKLELANGSRILALPGSESTIRCYSGVSLAVIDEASRCPDALLAAIRPMLSTSNGDLIALSTPFARLGWYFEAWHNQPGWKKVRIPASECPRISAAFLREELEALGRRWYSMEYECVFADAVDSLFTEDDIRAVMSCTATPLFG
jgi:hypothetical protein